MLVKFADAEHQGQCERCHRYSPMLAGDMHDAAKRLTSLGWMRIANDEWRCPVCCARVTGKYLVER
jgi:hypothetical protein